MLQLNYYVRSVCGNWHQLLQASSFFMAHACSGNPGLLFCLTELVQYACIYTRRTIATKACHLQKPRINLNHCPEFVEHYIILFLELGGITARAYAEDPALVVARPALKLFPIQIFRLINFASQASGATSIYLAYAAFASGCMSFAS